jgi:hypothetical protein
MGFIKITVQRAILLKLESTGARRSYMSVRRIWLFAESYLFYTDLTALYSAIFLLSIKAHLPQLGSCKPSLGCEASANLNGTSKGHFFSEENS